MGDSDNAVLNILTDRLNGIGDALVKQANVLASLRGDVHCVNLLPASQDDKPAPV